MTYNVTRHMSDESGSKWSELCVSTFLLECSSSSSGFFLSKHKTSFTPSRNFVVSAETFKTIDTIIISVFTSVAAQIVQECS